MLNKDILQNNINKPGILQKDSLLMVLAFDVDTPKSSASIREIAKEHGLWEIQNWNIASVLSRCKGLAINISEGWKLTDDGKEYVSSILGLKYKKKWA